jgi:hypothetical protein
MTMSSHMMVGFKLPMLACIATNHEYSFTTPQPTQECEIVWVISAH